MERSCEREEQVKQADMNSCLSASGPEIGEVRYQTTPRYGRGGIQKMTLTFVEKRRDVFRRDLPPSIPSFYGNTSIEPPRPSRDWARSI